MNPTESETKALRPEIENRIRNLFWTVSGDYSLDIRPDVDTFLRSKSLALYDAVKQGAFAAHFDPRALAVYAMQKQALGADGAQLTELCRLCIDAAVYPAASRARSGVTELRREAFRDLAAQEDFPGKLGQIRRSILCRFLGQPDPAAGAIADAAAQIEALGSARDTDAIIAAVDTLYNTLLDPDFVRRSGDLAAVRSVSMAKLADFRRDQEMNDEMMDRVLEEYLSILKDELLKTGNLRHQGSHVMADPAAGNDPAQEETPAEREKTQAFMQRQFGKSFLTPEEQEKLERELCTGIHRHCRIHLTRGILNNPAVKNAQFLRTTMQSMKNELYFEMKQQPIRKSVLVLGSMLRQVLIQQQDDDRSRAEFGALVPNRLWKVGRVQDQKLFDRVQPRNRGEIVVELLLDSSSSQTLRQPQIAAQGYIISQALSMAGIPHRVSSFCSYWNYTAIHRFRDYDDPESENRAILQYRAFGENRDGLAIRAVCKDLAARPEEKKILIMLSDGKPNHLGSSRPGTGKGAAYVGEAAIRDTALEIRKLRAKGIAVLGIFVGSEEDLTAEKRIFGKEFTYTKNISSFAHIVGRYLRRQIEAE